MRIRRRLAPARRPGPRPHGPSARAATGAPPGVPTAGLSRREILGVSAGLGLGGFASLLSGCAGPVRARPNPELLRTPRAEAPGRVVLGWSPTESMDVACRRAVDALGGLAWLRQGDSVLVKVSCNSSNEHPAVTSPEAVEACVRLLRERGAGRVIVGDQAGVEHVRLTAEGREGSTREVMGDNGLAEAVARSGAELVCFDELGWNGYRRAEADFDDRWNGGLWLTRVIDEVDHIVYLPRLGTHSLAGVTLGAKNGVGWLRDDSRRILHQRGDEFFELFAEVNHFRPLRERLRLVLTMGTAALLDIGPDFGTVVDFDAVVSVASAGLVEHDLVASSILLWLDDANSSFFDIGQPYPVDSDFFNRRLVLETWGPEAAREYRHLIPFPQGRGLAYDRCLSHLAAIQGARPSRIVVQRTDDTVPEELASWLRADPDGLFAV